MGATKSGCDRQMAEAKKIVFRLLKYRPRSEQEIRIKLKDKGMGESAASGCLQYFASLGLLNDRLFARGWIASRIRKPVGIKRIRNELRQKGIAADIIQDECAAALADYDEWQALQVAAQRRLKQYRCLDRRKAQQRLYAYLIRRGFPADLIFKTLKNMPS